MPTDCRDFGYTANDRWAKLPPGFGWKEVAAVATDSRDRVFVFSRGDNGLAYFLRHAQSALRRSDVGRIMRHVVVENAGHTFRPTAAQRALARLLDDFVAAPFAIASAGERSS